MKKKNVLMTVVAIFGLATIAMAQTVPSYVPTNGLVGWWPFNGNANDESGNGNNGTISGASLTSDRFGNSSTAYIFDGIDDYINVLYTNQLNGQTGTVNAWIKSSNTFSSQKIIFAQSSGRPQVVAASQGINGNQSSNSAGILWKATNGQFPNAQSASVVDNGDWIMITAFYTTDTFKVYINSLLEASVSTALTQDNCSQSDFQIGGFNTTPGCGNSVGFSQMFSGKIDDIGVWNRALTVCEIQDLYASQLNSTFVNAGADQTICNGDAVTLSTINSLNYSWDNGVTDGVAFNPTATQDYTVSADSAGCLSTDVVTVTVNENTSATQTQTALDSYTWTINSQTYTQSGTYTAVIPNAAGCDSTITLDLSLDFTGINEFSEYNLFTVFPNPAQSAINIKADNKLIGEIYTIYDNTGKVILTGKLNSQNTIIELGALSGGIYMFSVGENMKQTFKVIKE